MSDSTGGSRPRLAVSAAVAAMLFLLLLRPVYDVDIFWQCKLGELILANGGPIPAEPFAATHLGEPLPPLAWLGQAVYAQVRLSGGWTALRVFDALVWVGGFWAVAAACRRRGTPALGALVALGVGFMAAMPCASLRPQSLAALGFGLLLALLRLELSPLRTLLLAAPLFVLWQNLHPSATVAAISLAAAAGVGWLRYFAGFRELAPWLLTALTLLAAASVFATPAGYSVLAVSAYNARASLALSVNEWLPPWHRVNRNAGMTFGVAALVAGWLLTRNRNRIDWEEAAPALALFALTLTAHRFALFWGIAIIPVLARCLSPLGRVAPRLRPWGLGFIPVAIVVALVVRPTHFHPSLPLTGVAKLKGTGVAGTVYCHHAWGGPLIDAGHPQWTVSHDGRSYRYEPDEWFRYAEAVRGEIGLAELDKVYRPAAFFLRPTMDERLIAELRASAEWREVYADHACAAFVRK